MKAGTIPVSLQDLRLLTSLTLGGKVVSRHNRWRRRRESDGACFFYDAQMPLFRLPPPRPCKHFTHPYA
eukprot:scaffold65764_cov36-Tisochrysis_lutea.AAC.2